MKPVYKSALLGVALALAFGTASAQGYPNKPVRLIVPFAPGGFTDVVARILGQKLSVAMGQQFVIENKAGAGSTIGTDFVAKAAPDGYTLVMISTTHVISPWIYKTMPYDPIKSFTVVSKLVDSPYVLLVNPKVQANNVKELVALAKAAPETIHYASSGNGSSQHLMGGSVRVDDGCTAQACALPRQQRRGNRPGGRRGGNQLRRRAQCAVASAAGPAQGLCRDHGQAHSAAA
jgi:tripartite-type tricarboxylate transporter receptor subunit TctC